IQIFFASQIANACLSGRIGFYRTQARVIHGELFEISDNSDRESHRECVAPELEGTGARSLHVDAWALRLHEKLRISPDPKRVVWRLDTSTDPSGKLGDDIFV